MPIIKLKDTVYENGNHWVLRTEKGTFEVYKNGITHSTRCAVIAWEGKRGFERAKTECDKREVNQCQTQT